MIWFLLGLVIFSVFMGALASLMTITTVKNTVVGMSSGVDSATVRNCWEGDYLLVDPTTQLSRFLQYQKLHESV